MSKSISVGPFLLHEIVGKGGMGEVWQGVHAEQGLPVALKVITADAARQPRYLEAFRNEVTAVARLDHPGIVWVFDYGTVSEHAEKVSEGMLVAGSPYIAMEFASGGTLHGVMSEVDWSAVKRVLLELLDALAHAHARGVIHRDLKPGNVLLARTGDVRPGLKLTDFGIARAMDFKPEETGSKPLGTLHYMAPEQVKAEWRQQGPWTDLYAVGCMAYRLVSGRLPFKGMRTAALMHAQINKSPPPLNPRMDCPPEIADWIGAMMEKDPQRRFRRAADAAHALLSIPDNIADQVDVTSLAAQFTSSTRLPVEVTRVHAPFLPTSLAGTEEEDPSDGTASGSKLARLRQPQPRSWRRPIPTRPSPKLHGAGLGLWGIRAVPLVGRESERDVLWNALRETRRRAVPRLSLVRGPTGTGKTRLVQWIGERADEVGSAIVLEGRCSRNGPVGQGLRDMFTGFLRTASLLDEDLQDHVEEQLKAWRIPVDLAPRFCALCSPEGVFGDVRIEPAEKFEIVWQLIQHVASERALYMWFDNAHYDPEALSFARWLVSRGAEESLPCLVTLVVRDEDLAESPEAHEEIDALTELPDTIVVELQNLKTSHRSTLVRELLGLQPVLAAQVEQRTGGNPLFAIQLVSDWVASNMVVIGKDGFTLRDPEQATLPRSLDEVWNVRKARVVDGIKGGERMLEVAAVLGERVDLIEWSQVCDDPQGKAAGAGHMYFKPGAARSRHELVTRLFASSLAEETDDGWRFVHGMFREAILDEARKAGRLIEHHQAVAHMLSLADGGQADEERHAVHLVQAGDSVPAIPMLMRSVERRSHGSLPAALELVGRTEAALQATALATSDPLWGQVSLARCTLFLRLGRHRLAEERLDALLAAAKKHGWRDIQIRARIARVELAAAEEDAGFLEYATSLASAVTAQDELENFVRLRRALCQLYLQQRAYPQALEAASEVVQATVDLEERQQAVGWMLLASISYEKGDLDNALALYAHAVRVFQIHEDTALDLARCHLGLGRTYQERGALRRAQSSFRTAIRIFRRTGSGEVVFALMAMGELALIRESWRDGVVVWSHARRVSSKSRAPSVSIRCHSGLAASTAGLRDWTNCARHLADGERASEKLKVLHDRSSAAMLMEAAGSLHRKRRTDLATRALRLARRLASAAGDEERANTIDSRLEALA